MSSDSGRYISQSLLLDNPPVTLGGFLETFDNGRLPTIPIDSLAEAVGKSWSGDGELNLSRSLERHGLSMFCYKENITCRSDELNI